MAGPGAPKTGGREKGTSNRVTKQLKELILAALDGVGGQAYLERQAEKNPGPFLTLIGKVLPTTLSGDSDHPLRVYQRVAYVIVDPKEPDSAE